MKRVLSRGWGRNPIDERRTLLMVRSVRQPPADQARRRREPVCLGGMLVADVNHWDLQ